MTVCVCVVFLCPHRQMDAGCVVACLLGVLGRGGEEGGAETSFFLSLVVLLRRSGVHCGKGLRICCVISYFVPVVVHDVYGFVFFVDPRLRETDGEDIAVLVWALTSHENLYFQISAQYDTF